MLQTGTPRAHFEEGPQTKGYGPCEDGSLALKHQRRSSPSEECQSDSCQEEQFSAFGEEAMQLRREDSGTLRSTPNRKRARASPAHPASRDNGSPGSLVSGGRNDASLGQLTRRFLQHLQNAQDGIIDLNKAADVLKVPKRRIYDITNVLEGIGAIGKCSKNNIQWLGTGALGGAGAGAAPGGQRLDDEDVARLQGDIQALKDAELTLEAQITELSSAIRGLGEEPGARERLVVTDDDITSLPCFLHDTIFAVKAPPGATLEVPDPEEEAVSGMDHDASANATQRRYRILLKSAHGPIDVFLVQHPNTHTPSQGQGQQATQAACGQQAAATDTGRTPPHISSQQPRVSAGAAGSGHGHVSGPVMPLKAEPHASGSQGRHHQEMGASMGSHPDPMRAVSHHMGNMAVGPPAFPGHPGAHTHSHPAATTPFQHASPQLPPLRSALGGAGAYKGVGGIHATGLGSPMAGPLSAAGIGGIFNSPVPGMSPLPEGGHMRGGIPLELDPDMWFGLDTGMGVPGGPPGPVGLPIPLEAMYWDDHNSLLMDADHLIGSLHH